MSADPNGVTAVPRDAFVAALPQRQKLFDLMGASVIRLTALSENRLDDNYVLVHTQWVADLRDPSHPPLGLSSSFLVRQDGDSLLVVFYLNHQDIRALAQSRATDSPNSWLTWPSDLTMAAPRFSGPERPRAGRLG